MMPTDEEYMRRRQPGAQPLPPSPSAPLTSSGLNGQGTNQFHLQQQVADNERKARMAQYGLDPSTTNPADFDQWWESNIRNMGGTPLQGGYFFSHTGSNVTPEFAQRDPWSAFGAGPPHARRRGSVPLSRLMQTRRPAYGGY